MKTLKFLSLAAIIATTSYGAYAQDFTDALRYSNLSTQGTARSMGFGNALGSVGGDFASLSVNPAGLGIYRSSEIMFTPSMKINGTNGTYLGNAESNNNSRFNFNNLGVVFTSARKGRRYEKSDWKAVSFAFGVNRLADFNRDYSYSGTNSGPNSSSATENYVDDANRYGVSSTDDGTPSYIGYQLYLINPDVNGIYSTVVPFSTPGVIQSRDVSERGGVNELTFSLGANYKEKLMLGATIGLPIINYHRISTYTETPVSYVNDFNSYSVHEDLTTRGSGIDLKLGAIYKFSDYFRVGAAIHTPTYYDMHDVVTGSVQSDIQTQSNILTYPTNSDFSYSMTTPWRAVLSATGFMGRYGFISADYEYVDYSSARMHYDADFKDQETATNLQIKNTLKGASNIRVGAEGRVTDIFFVRLGFNYNGNPYKDDGGVNTNIMAYTGGLGLRFTTWFIDAALIHTVYNGIEQPYTSPYSNVVVPTATIKSNLNNAALTIGFKF